MLPVAARRCQTTLEDHGYSIVKSVGFVTLITTGGIPGFALAAWMLETIGRKPTTILFLVMSAVTAYIYGTASDAVVFSLGNGLDATRLFCAGWIMQFFMFGMWSCLYAYTPELYPTRARSTGAGFASAMGRIGAIIAPITIGYIIKDAGVYGVFALGAGSFLIAAVVVALLGVETRGEVLEKAADGCQRAGIEYPPIVDAHLLSARASLSKGEVGAACYLLRLVVNRTGW